METLWLRKGAEGNVVHSTLYILCLLFSVPALLEFSPTVLSEFGRTVAPGGRLVRLWLGVGGELWLRGKFFHPLSEYSLLFCPNFGGQFPLHLRLLRP